MIRRYYPKGTDFTTITSKELQLIINKINNYPRKQFSFETSASLFAKELLKFNISIQLTI